VPVNYRIRRSGLVTTLTARRVRDGVGAGQYASPRLCCVRPPPFFNKALNLSRTAVVAQASPSSTFRCESVFPAGGYDLASEKNASRLPVLTR
jgi:hypothetical protein